MEQARAPGEGVPLDTGPHFADEPGGDTTPAWEEIEAGRYMPRRIRGSFRGRALG